MGAFGRTEVRTRGRKPFFDVTPRDYQGIELGSHQGGKIHPSFPHYK
jgi:hypothetical protein